ncbi:hypothetical protein J5A73_01160 [Leptotrichia sp. oral taxon 218]|jgi:membrane protein|uniref:hypothetical protein n=1 Tax=Leptotrichia sp. oral taxon 218 TaxID=712361 RepID=UPI001B8C431E|nr:hypothetical protein [Leptotrichia sp. oral taxon 218]QUB95523.1 hypothetical protein J5A73_01160 [Leptotrichia sp. oral taxon 218]
MIINYGNSIIAKNIENVILFGKNSMKIVILNIILIVFILMVLNILYEIFLILVENNPSKVISKLVNELIFFGFLFFILINWINGLNILENIIEPLIFKKIPKYIFNFQIEGKNLFIENGTLLNLDILWKTLEEIPKRIYTLKDTWTIFLEWILKSNLGTTIILILLKIFMYFLIIIFFSDILQLILTVHLIYIFSGISFIFLIFKPLRENYGLMIPKLLISNSIQYYLTFILVGICVGYLKFIYSIGGKFVYIVAIFLLMGIIKNIIKTISQIGTKI